MGLIGFLTVLGIRRREDLPDGFARGMALAIVATAILGIVAHAFIDNAAHLGGLLAGVFLGGLLIGPAEKVSAPSLVMRWMGFGALAVFTLGVAAAVLVIVRNA
jgi:membrane associated rhomboid family serine protease